RCRQPSITATHLDIVLGTFLGNLGVRETLHEWGSQQVTKARTNAQEGDDQRTRSLQHAYDEATRALRNLTTLRIRDVIGDDEFRSQREALLQEQFRLQGALAKRGNQWFEPAVILLSFSNRAANWYEQGDAAIKRRIIYAIGS